MAAPLGFKDFATGDILTAADVDGYLMQGVWVFANAAARTSAVTSPEEGNMSFLKDTNSLEYYSGSAWVAVDTTGTVPPQIAGKNKIINGDFNINQRNFTSNTASAAFNFDRWYQSNSGGTVTATPQTFTLGAAPVAGYEGKNFLRLQSATQSAAGDYAAITQIIESVRTFANQTVTVSFWAKATSGTPNIGVSILQNFGTGGSPSSQVITSFGVQAITTSWVRYTFSGTIPSISGKTIGTNNNDGLQFNIWSSVGTTISGLGYPAVGIQNNTFDFWGVQVEAGSSATPFATASGNSPQGELAMCQRYYYRETPDNQYGGFGMGVLGSTTFGYILWRLPVQMRAQPTLSVSSTASHYQTFTGGAGALATCSAAPSAQGFSKMGCFVYFAFTSPGAGNAAGQSFLGTSDSAFNGYLAASAEL